MAFNFLRWITGKTDGEPVKSVTMTEFLNEDNSGGVSTYLQRMAFWTCVRKIGYAVGAVEWATIRRGKSVQANEYWAWNHTPNPNQNRQEFFLKLIGQLYYEQHAIVVEYMGYRYVADGFSVQRDLTGDIYTDITSDSQMIPGVFRSDDILVFRIEGDRIRTVLSCLSGAAGKLINSSADKFIRDSGRHGVLKVDELAESDKDFNTTYEDLINDKFKKYFTARSAVLPLFKGYEYEEDKGSGQTQANTRDIRALMDDIIELTAEAFGVPVPIITGKNVKEEDFRTFMTFTVKPLVEMIQNEINIKTFGKALVYKKTCITANLGKVRYIDVFDVANPIDKLIGSGAFCVNDIRKRLGMDVIDEEWAWQHWMTKNYSSVEDLLTCVDDAGEGETEGQSGSEKEGQGGEEKEKQNVEETGDQKEEN